MTPRRLGGPEIRDQHGRGCRIETWCCRHCLLLLQKEGEREGEWEGLLLGADSDREANSATARRQRKKRRGAARRRALQHRGAQRRRQRDGGGLQSPFRDGGREQGGGDGAGHAQQGAISLCLGASVPRCLSVCLPLPLPPPPLSVCLALGLPLCLCLSPPPCVSSPTLSVVCVCRRRGRRRRKFHRPPRKRPSCSRPPPR